MCNRSLPSTMKAQSACESCGAAYEKGTGRGYNNRVFCQTCLDRTDLAALRGRNKHLKRTYGMTEYDFNVLFIEQGSACSICKADHAGRDWGFVVDHCHATDKVRGILCHPCNVALGHAKDDITILKSMIDYLLESRSKPVK
jgi:hypothetical protein